MHPPERWWIGVGGLLIITASFAALWHWSPLSEWADPETLAEELEALARGPWAPVTLGVVYLVATPIVFPIMALNLALILAIGPMWGIGYALYGTLLAGLAALWAGRYMKQSILSRIRSDSVDTALRVVRESGLPGLILLRLVPIAPYPVVNLVLGAGGVGVGVFLLGTLLGVLPGLILMGVVGFQLRQVVQDPSVEGAAVLVGLAVACVCLGVWLRRRLSARLAGG